MILPKLKLNLKLPKLFPHYSRRIAALFLWLIVVTFASLNLLGHSPQVLGLTSSPLEEVKKNLLPQNVAEEIKLWQTINRSFPDYKYSYIKLAQSYLSVGENDHAQNYIDKLLSLDPENEIGLKLKASLE
ncbi:hypothetical protein HY407_04410 [Candidatus Gottesmanbacteria bacterium]|nr:hypothetical protein [Candidatus Gottesmanbacteria bacterium]